MRAAVLLAILLAPALARADWGDWSWAADLDIDARLSSNRLREDAAPIDQAVWDMDLRGLASPTSGMIHFAAGLNVQVGAELPGAFHYGFRLSPFGLALRPYGRAYAGVLFGIGVGGVAPRVPFAVELPARLFVGFDLGKWVRVSAEARAAWTPWAEERQDGATSADFVDELELSFGLGFGERHDEYRAHWSDQTFVGVLVREQMGERFVGVVLSAALNGTSD